MAIEKRLGSPVLLCVVGDFPNVYNGFGEAGAVAIGLESDGRGEGDVFAGPPNLCECREFVVDLALNLVTQLTNYITHSAITINLSAVCTFWCDLHFLDFAISRAFLLLRLC